MTTRISWAAMQTYTGRRVGLLMPTADDISLLDIAHALSMQCRYNGHTRAFYSVAQHSYVVSFLADLHPLWGLLHDAAEAYVGDMSAPWKHTTVMGKLYEEHERAFQRAVCDRFGLEYAMPEDVRAADQRIWHREKELFLFGDTEWTQCLDIPPDPRADILLVEGWSPEESEYRFLRRFEELYRDRER